MGILNEVNDIQEKADQTKWRHANFPPEVACSRFNKTVFMSAFKKVKILNDGDRIFQCPKK